MAHSTDLIATIASAFGLAIILGFIAVRIGVPALVGYLIAGILLGPNVSPGYFVADMELAQQLSEIGVMLLMFGVGLHLSLDDLLSVRKIAFPGSILQIVVATLMGAGLAALWGWDLFSGLIFGLALSVASTVVVLRTLETEGIVETFNGRIALGWLVVEDIVMVLVLVLLPPLAHLFGGDVGGLAVQSGGAGSVAGTLGLTLGSVLLFITLMLIVGRRVFPWMLWQVAKTGSRELFTLCVIAAAISIAYGSAALWSLFCGDGPSGIGLQPQSRRGVSSSPGCLLGDLLCVGRNAV